MLYQMCVEDGVPPWSANQADDIVDSDDKDILGYRWDEVKSAKLKKIVWEDARNLIDALLSSDVVGRPDTWDVVINHPFLRRQQC